MKRLFHIIIALICVSCSLEKFPEDLAGDPSLNGSSSQIAPAAYVSSTELPPAATKALIDVSTVAAINANVLVIDEKIDGSGAGLYEFGSWEDAYLSEATVSSAPSKQGLRSMSLNPVQAYKVGENGSAYYHTRMISWYPQTCNLYKNDEGKASVIKLKDLNEINDGSLYSGSGNAVTLKFKDLDGSKDVMVSNIVEGQYWHVNDGSEVVDGVDRYTLPFGTNESNPAYSNYMTYKHCLSAVKVYASTSNSEQVVSMWGAMRKVLVKNQPSALELSLPSPNSMNDATIDANVQTNALDYGSAKFTGNVDFPLIKTPMYGDENSGDQEVAEDAPSLVPDKDVYLGYALIKPNDGSGSQKLELDIHTDAGVLSVSLPMGEYFEAGYIYKVNISFNTTGAIAEIVLKSGSEHYFDLSSGTELDGGIHEYQHANCYIIHPGIVREHKDGAPVYYDGYAFDATKVGSATSQIYSSFYGSDRTTDLIDPIRAGLLWESSEGLITQIEYLYGYVRFKVQPPGSDNYKEGNAVIAAYDSQRKVLWSWHIWVTDEPQPVTYSIGNKKIIMLDRNLGATAATATTTDDLLETYGLYYQWGRKDPSMGPPSYNYRPQSTATTEYYDFYGSMWNYAGVVTVDRPDIRDGVENPMFLILPSDFSMTTYQYDWMYTNIDNLWGDQNAKTIYDPCPYGYMVPQDEISTLFASASPTLVSGGYKIGDTFFPFAGYKGVDKGVSSLSGAWRYVGYKGDYMSSKIDANGHRSRTYISSTSPWVEYGADADNDGDGDASRTYASNIHADDMTNRRTAASVRCVKIDRSLNSTLFATFVGDRTYAFVGDGEITFDYSVKTNDDNVNIKSAYIDKTTDVTTVIDPPLVADGAGSKEIYGKKSFAIPQDVGTGLVRYRLVSESSDGVVSRIAHALRLFAVSSFEVAVNGSDSYTSVETLGKCSYTQSYDARFTLRGIETDFSVVVNGVLATKVSAGTNGLATDVAKGAQCVDMDYEVSGINIPGHIHLQILDAEGLLACEKSYDVEMEQQTSYTKGEIVSSADELQGGGLYFIRTYGTYYNYYLKYDATSNKLIWVEYDPDEALTLTSDMVFRYHRDDSQGGGISPSYPQSAGAWVSPAAPAGSNYLQDDFTFGEAATAVYTTCATYLQSTVLYYRNTSDYFYFDTKNNPNWGALGKYYHYRWDVYSVN